MAAATAGAAPGSADYVPARDLASRGEHQSLQSLEQEHVASFQAFSLAGARLAIGFAQRIAGGGAIGKVAFRIHVFRQTPVPELANPHQFIKPLHPAVVIHVPVGGDKVVQVVTTCQVVEGVYNALGVAILQAGPT